MQTKKPVKISPRLIFSAIFLLTCTALSAQIVEKDNSMRVYGMGTFMIVDVIDRATSAPMEGAAVFLSCGKDTLKTVSSDNGIAVFSFIPFRKDRDTVKLDISFLGYKSLEYTTVLKESSSMEARMEEDPQMLSEIIVRDRKVLMVVKGDTTIYKTSALNMMDGSTLLDVVRKLPGISLSEGRIYAKGAPVSKILINGSAMFGSNLGAALEMVRTEDIKEVKVYDQYDQDRLIEADTLGLKERVLDVATRKPVKMMRELALLASAGLYTSENIDGGHDPSASLSGSYRQFSKESPTIVAKAGLGHDSDDGKPSDSPSRNADASFSIDRNIRFRKSWRHSLDLGYSGSSSRAYSREEYVPTGHFSQRTTEEDRNTGRRDMSGRYSGSIGYSIGKASSIKATWSADYGYDSYSSGTESSILTDGVQTLSAITAGSGLQSWNASLGIDFRHNFGKPGRTLSVSLDYRYSGNDGWSDRVDTTRTSTVRQWVTSDEGKSSNTLELNARYEEPLLGHNLRLTAQYDADVELASEHRLAYDELLMDTDILNTFRYSRKHADNRIFAGLYFQNGKRNFSGEADVVMTHSVRIRDEYFPDTYRYPRSYLHISPKLKLSWMTQKFYVSLDYNELQQVPSTGDTRGVLDDSSPLFLKAGNPDLKQSIVRNAVLNAGFYWGTNSLSLLLTFMDRDNAIVRRTVYFHEDTEIPEYGYTAVAGSSLSVPVNIDGDRMISASLNFNRYFQMLSTNFSAGPGIIFTQTPFMTGETVHTTAARNVNIALDMLTTISRYVTFNVNSATYFGRNSIDGKKVYDNISENLVGSLKVNFLKYLWLRSDVLWTMMKTDSSAAPGYSNAFWNAGVSVKFGKSREFEIGLDCYDILDNEKPWLVKITEDYVSSSYRDNYGRSVILSFRFRM